jgi:hypothetical protein
MFGSRITSDVMQKMISSLVERIEPLGGSRCIKQSAHSVFLRFAARRLSIPGLSGLPQTLRQSHYLY